MSCGKKLTEANRKQAHGGNSVPVPVQCCFACWTQLGVYHRLLVTIACKDRQIGGVLSEMASALDRLDQSRSEDEPGEDWKLGDSGTLAD